MRHRPLFVALASISLLLIPACGSPQKDNTSHNRLSETVKSDGRIHIPIADAWVRPASKGGNSAGYLRIINGTTNTDTLLAVQTESARHAEVHESFTTVEGLAGMRPTGALPVASGDSLVLQPGSRHIMLMGLKRNLSAGDSIGLTLRFAVSGTIPVKARVRR